MDVRVDYIAQVKNAAGVAHEFFPVDDSVRIMDLLRGLAGRHGAEFQSLVFDDTGNVRPSILVAVNDEQVMPDAAVPLHLGDSVAILSPMSGG